MTERLSGLAKKLQLLEPSIQGLNRSCVSNLFQKVEKKVTSMENCETQYEHTINKPVKFLRFVKRFPLSNAEEIPKILEPYRYVMKQRTVNREYFFPIHDGLMEYRKPIKRSKKSVELPGFRDSFDLPGIRNCLNICFVPPNLFWVNNGFRLFLTNTHGDILHRINSSYSFTANVDKIMYVDGDFSIQKLSYDKENSTLFIRKPAFWLPLSIHCCPSNGDLLVGMILSISNPPKARIVRYNELGGVEQTIYQNKEVRVLYRYPRYITENRNGDIVVSDVMMGRIVVTNHKGEFRFFSPVDNPRGICTDRLPRILVSRYSKDVLVLDENGLVLVYLRIEESPGSKNILNMGPRRSQEKKRELCLTYDDHNDLLWVGSNDCNTVSGYKIYKEEGMYHFPF